ncbi:MAG: hypothetical protein M3O46_09675 [Myxococcota bacterium]|nr:hypothetical protein [Myxococcota bacterium]
MRILCGYFAPLGVCVVTVACTNAGVRESTVTGTAALTTFLAAPSTIVARDEAGRVWRTKVDAQGQFALALAKGHTYRLAFERAATSVSVVFPRSSGKVDATFVLKTNGAWLPLGRVRYYAGAPATGFHVLASRTPTVVAGADCVDCVDDDPRVTCGEGESEGTVASAADNAEQADPKGEMAVGDQNVPEEVDGCDGQEGDNADLQQTGEH